MDLSDVKLNSPETSDREGDTFEDAQDTVNRKTTPDHNRSRSSNSARSLIDDRPTSSLSVRSLTDRSGSSSTPVDRRPPNILADQHSSDSEEPTPRFPKTQTHSEQDKKDLLSDMVSPKDITTARDGNSSSPLLTARRVSTIFDEVQLVEKDVTESEEPIENRGRSTTASSQASERSQSRSSTTMAPQGSNSTTPVIGGPPAPSWGPASKQMPAAVTRKLSSPFAWLSRKKPVAQGSNSPPPPLPRRHTATSINNVGSSPDFMLSKLDEDRVVEGRLPAKELLKERFKILRMREEAGINIDQLSPGSRDSLSAAVAPATRTAPEVGLGIKTSKSVLEEEDSSLVTSPNAAESDALSIHNKSRSGSVASAFDPNLAPGTVAGMNSGPSAMHDPESPVDWDLWQSVVYEGPAAVAKTSAAELNCAIASGIPSAIRGVVWQVLAQSKNEELEGVYRELVNRGTDKELAPSPNPNVQSAPASANSLASTSTHKESIASSASSTHSEASTPATTNGMTSPVHSTHQEIEMNSSKVQAAMNAERQKKAKDDLASLRKLEKTIRKDLGSRSNFSKYAAAAGLQDALFGVCKAYALFDEGVGYTQGMNFIIMPLLFNMTEEEAFCLLVKLMNQYRLREMFIQDMPGLHLHLYQFERLLEDVEPALCYHLHKRGVVPSLYATQWFMTLFAYRFPLQLVLRVYDLILSEGLEGAILKFGIALMQKNAEALLNLQDMSQLKVFLNERLFDVYIDSAPSAHSILESGFFGNSGGSDKEVYRADLLVQDACAVKISPEVLKQYTSDYENRIRIEKERETEFENLRSANASLALKIRALEQRAEKSDTDHVQMATEMIRSKMENEEIRTANQELQVEVEALKKIVASQPEEVELRLKDEMQRIMSRNIEVQNENRALEEQMADMEKDLVETKMQFAQINADYDTLKQKWADLRRALDG